MPCSGDVEQACGGDKRITVYKAKSATRQITPAIAGFEYLGCYTDSVGARTLSTGIATDGGSSGLTATKCMDACHAENFKYAGVEYSGECFCGNDLLNNGHLAEDGEALCNMPCSGDGSSFCGEPNRLDFYAQKSSSTTATITTTKSSAASSVPSAWTSVGCYTDQVAARALAHGVEVRGSYMNMTIDGCLEACAAKGFIIAGLEYAQECFCGNRYDNGAALASDGNALCKEIEIEAVALIFGFQTLSTGLINTTNVDPGVASSETVSIGCAYGKRVGGEMVHDNIYNCLPNHSSPIISELSKVGSCANTCLIHSE